MRKAKSSLLKKGENKKIKNAQTKVYNNIQFKSLLEVNCYKELLSSGITNVEYESHTYLLKESINIKSNIILYTFDKNNNIKKFSTNVRKIEYTPDFILIDDLYTIIIECKGYMNDIYPLKRKLFFNTLNKLDKTIYFFEVNNLYQIKNMVEVIKQIINN